MFAIVTGEGQAFCASRAISSSAVVGQLGHEDWLGQSGELGSGPSREPPHLVELHGCNQHDLSLGGVCAQLQRQQRFIWDVRVPDHWVKFTTASIREPTLAGCVGTTSDLGPERDRRQRHRRPPGHGRRRGHRHRMAGARTQARTVPDVESALLGVSRPGPADGWRSDGDDGPPLTYGVPSGWC